MSKILQVPSEYRTYKWLYQKYIIEKLPSQKIADIVGADRKTIDQWLAKVKIFKRGFGGSLGKPTKEWLINEYIENKKSLNDIAKIVNQDRKTVHRWLAYYKIKSHKVGETRMGKDNQFWREGKHIYTSKSRGYRYIYKPGHPMARKSGYVPEHRFIVSELLGRNLERNEEVHHINFNEGDNRLENLYLFSSKSDHMLYHRKLARKEVGFLKSNLIEK
jgi:hypothetical protein